MRRPALHRWTLLRLMKATHDSSGVVYLLCVFSLMQQIALRYVMRSDAIANQKKKILTSIEPSCMTSLRIVRIMRQLMLYPMRTCSKASDCYRMGPTTPPRRSGDRDQRIKYELSQPAPL